ncbi:MAG: shikimate dehydrogenase [Gammaproteobacteria bacterium]
MFDINLFPGVDNYGVMGNPVAHSKSPQIHAAFARQTGEPVAYQAIYVELDKFPAALDEFQRLGGKGLNITLPFKEAAWQSAQVLTTRVDRAHAVNTLWFGLAGKRHGDITDGIGLVRDLTVNHDVRLSGKDVLVLGAGGAVRGILDPLFDQEPARIVIANRTVSRAIELARLFLDRGELVACDYESLRGQRFHAVINGTSASLRGSVPPLPDDLLLPDACCYDMMYAESDTVFVTWARAHHAGKALDGIGMLVEQAAESFHIWRGVRPETRPVIAMLRKS